MKRYIEFFLEDNSRFPANKTLNVIQSFSKKDLPKEHRVVEHDSVTTADHKADRYVLKMVI